MQASHERVNRQFDSSVAKSYEDLKSEYDAGMNQHPDRNEVSRRRHGLERCRQLRSRHNALPSSRTDSENPVLFCMLARYEEFVITHYHPGDTRFAEWFEMDWKEYLRTTHHINDPHGHRTIPNEMMAAARLSRSRISEFLAFEVAYRQIEAQHDAILYDHNRDGEQAEDQEPEAYVVENEGIRKIGSFDRWQCTALIVTLIDALTRHTLEADYEPIEGVRPKNIHNLNVSALAEMISRISGLSSANIKKDIYKWRNGTAMDGDNRIKKVKDALLSFDVDVDVSLLNEAIDRTRS